MICAPKRAERIRIKMKFREMRRNGQQLSEAECLDILNRNTCGVLAVSGDEGYPYAVPLSYVCCDGRIYIHCAKSGHKLDAVKNHDKVSFCVVDQDLVVPSEYTTYFRSVILFGRACVLEDRAEIEWAIERLGKKYYPEDREEHLREVIAKSRPAMSIIRIEIEHMTGKEAKELVRERSRRTDGEGARMSYRICEKGLPEDAWRIREEVFIQEQGFQRELDEIDDTAAHIVLYDAGDIPVATCRVFPDAEPGVFVLGRLAVKKEYRGKHVGCEALGAAESYVRDKDGKALILHSQCRAVGFYRQNGFREYGEVELDEGCPHIWMRKEI